MYDTTVFEVFFNFQMTNVFPGSGTLSDDWLPSLPSCLLTVASAAILVQISYFFFLLPFLTHSVRLNTRATVEYLT